MEIQNFGFVITGHLDSNSAKNESRQSISGYSTFLCGAPISMKSKKQGMTTLSVTESEMVAAVSAVQDMLYVMRVLESIELKEQLPMVLEVDNKGVVDLAINWSVGERTHHISIRVNFL
jgi:hypothetical protein